MAKGKFYVVWKGKSPGIYQSWDECKAQVQGVEGAQYKSYDNKIDATKAFREKPEKQLYSNQTVKKESGKIPRSRIIPQSISVDAACSGNPGDMEYRCVVVDTGQEVFRVGPLKEGTNNIGEFLALVHALAMLQKKNDMKTTIYTDSITAISWVRNKKAKTTLTQTKANEPIFELIDRAENWLARNQWTNKIVKWETQSWGEIPADFGRK